MQRALANDRSDAFEENRGSKLVSFQFFFPPPRSAVTSARRKSLELLCAVSPSVQSCSCVLRSGWPFVNSARPSLSSHFRVVHRRLASSALNSRLSVVQTIRRDEDARVGVAKVTLGSQKNVGLRASQSSSPVFTSTVYVTRRKNGADGKRSTVTGNAACFSCCSSCRSRTITDRGGDGIRESRSANAKTRAAAPCFDMHGLLVKLD